MKIQIQQLFCDTWQAKSKINDQWESTRIARLAKIKMCDNKKLWRAMEEQGLS